MMTTLLKKGTAKLQLRHSCSKSGFTNRKQGPAKPNCNIHIFFPLKCSDSNANTTSDSTSDLRHLCLLASALKQSYGTILE